MENIINNRELVILNDFFNLFIGTKDSAQLLDVAVTHSIIAEVREGKNNSFIKVDRHEARDIHFIFGNGKFTTYRVLFTAWYRIISVLKKMNKAATEQDLITLSQIQSPLEEVVRPSNPKHLYSQPMVMMHLGLDWPVSHLEFEHNPDFDGVTTGDLNVLERKFETLGRVFTEAAKVAKANINVLAGAANIVRDHNLHFNHFIDIKSRHIAVSLTRHYPEVDFNDEEASVIIPKAFVADEWKDIFTDEISMSVARRLEKIYTSFNNYVDEHFNEEKLSNPLLKYVSDDMFKGIIAQIMPVGDLVYEMQAVDLKDKLNTAVEEILQFVKSKGDNARLDLISWRVYDYTDVNNPVIAADLMKEDILRKWRGEFITLLYSAMLNSNHALLKPFSEVTVITDKEEMKARPIGDTRYEPITSGGLREGQVQTISAETSPDKSELH